MSEYRLVRDFEICCVVVVVCCLIGVVEKSLLYVDEWPYDLRLRNIRIWSPSKYARVEYGKRFKAGRRFDKT